MNMEINESRICIVLARSGSKRLPQKNIQKINGETLIELAILCSEKNNITTIVSSDSNDVLDQIKSKKAIRHKRSSLNSDDSTTSEQSLIEVLKYYNISSQSEILLIPPTNPTRTAEDLALFIDQWETIGKPNGYDQAFSVLSMQNDFWYSENEKLKRVRDVIFQKVEPRVSFKRERIYLETSAIYLSYAHLLYKGVSLVGSNPYPIELSKIASIDIDTINDLELARRLMQE
jgi:CMP-N-acetylneuraminic acid synthetase